MLRVGASMTEVSGKPVVTNYERVTKHTLWVE